MSTTTSAAAAGTVTAHKAAPHLLIFPYPAQGHALPLLDLTHQLALLDFTITIITTSKNLSSVSPLFSSHSKNIHPLVFPMPSHPSLPPGVEHVQQLGNSGNLPIISSLSKLHDPIIQWFRSHHNPPVALISDFFLGSTLRLATEVNIPRFVFQPTRAFLASVIDHCWDNIDVVNNSDVIHFDGLSKTTSFQKEHLPSIFRLYDKSHPDWEIVKDGLLGNMLSYGFIFDTFDALEADYLAFLKNKLGHHRVFGVGPLCLLGLRSDLDLGSSGYVYDWLDGCPDGSVVYVCFGSQKLMNNAQLEALATGLEKSMARFIWVVKTGMAQQVESGYGALPDGFEERVTGRGLVIRGWAPQVKILSHTAVGGFLSHCGWNSVIEGIVSGVMILAWPMEADQFVNEKLLVEDLGVAVRVCMGGNSVPDSVELGKLISESMNGVGYEDKKMKAKELASKALGAIRDGGTSARDLDGLVNELRKLQVALNK